MEEKKTPVCPICNREIDDDHKGENIKIAMASDLYWRTRDLSESKNTDLAVTEQIRRNCETIVELLY